MLPIKEIMNSLPHRYPFLFVDRITEIKYLEFVIGYKNVSHNEPWVSGHFPGDAIFPGVLLIETAAQVCGFIFYNAESNKALESSYLSSVKNFKFIKLIRPGDQVEIRGTFMNKALNFAEVSCEVFVDNEKVAKGILRYYFNQSNVILEEKT